MNDSPYLLLALCSLFWSKALKKVQANTVGISLYLIPLYTTTLSVLFLGEDLRFYHVLGGAFIFTGVLLVTHPG